MKGKTTCETLKAIRRKIAEQNGIVYEPVVCNHKGDCRGTCPLCEEELRYLESQIQQKQTSGKNVAIWGIAAGLGLLTPQISIAQEVDSLPKTEQTIQGEKVKVTGKVVDGNGMEIPGAEIFVNNKTVSITDLDGKFSISAHIGDTLTIKFLGYCDKKRPIPEEYNNLIFILEEENITTDFDVFPGYLSPESAQKWEEMRQQQYEAKKKEKEISNKNH